MAAWFARSPLRAYLAMALTAVAVVVALNAVAQPSARRGESAPTSTLPRPSTPPERSLERDFLTTVLGRPRTSRTARYCDDGGCCPTWRTTFGTTAPTHRVIEAFEVQGYVARAGGGAAVRGGPFPQARWTGVLDLGGRWAWRRAEVSRGADVGRSSWPTVFVQSSVACGHR